MGKEELDYGDNFRDDTSEELKENPNVDLNPDVQGAHNLLRNFLQEPNEAQQESEDLAGMDDLIARTLHIDKNNENDE